MLDHSLGVTWHPRSHRLRGAYLWVGSRRNWSVFLEGLCTGRHGEAPVCCPCSRLAALHGAPRTRCLSGWSVVSWWGEPGTSAGDACCCLCLPVICFPGYALDCRREEVGRSVLGLQGTTAFLGGGQASAWWLTAGSVVMRMVPGATTLSWTCSRPLCVTPSESGWLACWLVCDVCR